jgi:hypothetical protein
MLVTLFFRVFNLKSYQHNTMIFTRIADSRTPKTEELHRVRNFVFEPQCVNEFFVGNISISLPIHFVLLQRHNAASLSS